MKWLISRIGCNIYTSYFFTYQFHKVFSVDTQNCLLLLLPFRTLNMLGMYFYTLIIGHKSCNMLSIKDKLTLQRELQNVVTNNVFLDKTQQQQNKKSNIKTLAGARN